MGGRDAAAAAADDELTEMKSIHTNESWMIPCHSAEVTLTFDGRRSASENVGAVFGRVPRSIRCKID